jgi:uncharacterized protein YcfJ
LHTKILLNVLKQCATAFFVKRTRLYCIGFELIYHAPPAFFNNPEIVGMFLKDDRVTTIIQSSFKNIFMQKILYSVAAVAVVTFASCTGNNSRIASQSTGIPTLTPAEEMKFQQWKEFQEWKEEKALKEKTAIYAAAAAAAAPKPVVKTRTVYVKQPVASTSSTTTTTTKKKGWSKAAKGTAIGAGVGAAAGAIIGKNNRALGAVIGGVAGGGIGYGIGRSMDKKDGRY